MTPFAQLGTGEGLEKEASSLLRGLHGLVRNGLWRTVARNTRPGQAGWRGGANRVSRWFHNPNAGKIGDDGFRTGKATPLSKGLDIYGFGGLGASALGYQLPGHTLALNATMPGMGALFSAPGAITSIRMKASQGNQNALKGDVLRGARNAGADAMSLAHTDPSYLTQPGKYSEFMSQYSPQVQSLAEKYRSRNVTPMSSWDEWSSALINPQKVINNHVDRGITEVLDKSGSMEKSGMSALRTVGRGLGKGFKHGFPWLFPVAGAGMIGHAVLRDKPYDPQQAVQRGYAGAQAKIQDRINNLSGFERMAMRFDPTIFGKKMESQLPGTIGQWERNTGQKFRPGMISRTVDNWSKGGDHNYYEYDAAGKRHYI